PHPPDPRALPAHPPPAGGRQRLPPRHAPRRVVPAPGAARLRAHAAAPREERRHDLARGAAARLPAPALDPARAALMEPIRPDWPAPANVRALVTTRALGNMGGEGLLRLAPLVPGEPVWLKQVHGTTVVDADTRPSR